MAREFASVVEAFGLSAKVREFNIMILRYDLPLAQMLAFAGDNASNVDAMTHALETKVKSFRGMRTRVRCLLHIFNLVVQVLLGRFDSGSDEDVGDMEEALQDVLGGLEGGEDDDESEDEEDDLGDDADNEEGEGDASEGAGSSDHVPEEEVEAALASLNDLSDVEREDLKAALPPVRLVLKKVSTTHLSLFPCLTHVPQLSKFSNTTVNSSTKILPAWKRHLKALSVPVRVAPRVVKTRWNSMFDLLNFACQHCDAIDSFMAKREHGMRELELSKEEWDLVVELRDILKVRRAYYGRGRALVS